MPDKIYSTPQKQIDAIETAVAGTLGKMVAVPAAANAAGSPGQFAVDADYLYLCIDSGNWVVCATTTWPT